MMATTARQSVLRIVLYRAYALMPDGAGRFEVFRPSGVQCTFAGRALFSLRGAKALVRLDQRLRRAR